MTLTSISQAARDRERVNLFVDGEFALGIDKNTLTHFGLHQGMEISAELLSEISRFDTIQYLYRRMVGLWLKRPRSALEMKMKMQQLQKRRQSKLSNDQSGSAKAAPGQGGEIAQVLERMIEMGYTDDKFAEWYVTERGRQGKYGPRKVLAELQSKGISQQVANVVITKFFPENNLEKELLQKKFGVSKLSEIKDVKEKARAWRMLKSRGF